VPAAQSTRPPASDGSPCAIETTERVVAVGDVHGAHDRFAAILRQAGLIDARERWSGGRAILVQTGDVLDRGPDSRRVVDLLRRLEGEAARAGGRVYALLGNHEVMRIVADLRYVSEGEYAAFRSLESEELRERYYSTVVSRAKAAATGAGVGFDEPGFRTRFIGATPFGLVEMLIAFGPRETYGRWVRDRLTMVRINGIVFLHGGTSPAVAALGCAAINATVRTELAMASAGTDPQELLLKTLIGRDDGPLWYRGLAEGEAVLATPEVDTVLQALDARAVVIGHTVASGGRIRTRFGRQIVQIDTGMLGGRFYPDGRASALEIRGDTLTAVYEDRREVMGTLPPLPPSPRPASAPAPESRPAVSAAP